MTEEIKSTTKKIRNYFWNGLLILIILILIIPSWRISFQGWFQSFFMSEIEFNTDSDSEISIPESYQNWALFDSNNNLLNFSDFKGKPIILSFWATWCPPCRAELPELEELKSAYKNQISILAVSEESIETINDSGLSDDYDFLFSTPGIPDFFELKSYPTLFIIDKKMTIVFRNEGAGKMNSEKNKQFLESLIRK